MTCDLKSREINSLTFAEEPIEKLVCVQLKFTRTPYALAYSTVAFEWYDSTHTYIQLHRSHIVVAFLIIFVQDKRNYSNIDKDNNNKKNMQ